MENFPIKNCRKFFLAKLQKHENARFHILLHPDMGYQLHLEIYSNQGPKMTNTKKVNLKNGWYVPDKSGVEVKTGL